MKDVIPLPQIPVEKARLEHRRYCKLLKTHPDDHMKTMKKAYYAFSKGLPVIDIYQAFKAAGKFKNDRPRLAISRAHNEHILFQRRRDSTGSFWSPASWEWFGNDYTWGEGRNATVRLPANTFDPWVDERWRRSKYIVDTTCQTVVPTIPAEHYPKGHLKNYFILWEVDPDGWKPIPIPPGDPLLLKRLSPNLFTVLAAWDLTELEKAVLRGALMR